MPESVLTIAPDRALAPRSLMVATRITLMIRVIAADNVVRPSRARANRAAAARLGGGARAQRPRPSNGSATPAKAAISAARGSTRATDQAIARAYHQA